MNQPGLRFRRGLNHAAGVSAPVIPDHELLRLIGRGSYGEVWLARSALGTFRAVKLVSRAAFGSRRPYEREFLGVQRYEPVSRSHAGLVDILQVGHHEAGGFFYYVMELADAADTGTAAGPTPTGAPAGPRLPGEIATYVPLTLEHAIRTRKRLPVAECIALFQALGAALDFLHRQSLVHRDIKPANIIFVRGQPMLADIGLVAEVAEAASFVGTEGFIPPEGPGKATADIYSLGKVIYEAATGMDRNDYPSLPPDLLETPERLPMLELNAVIARACAPAVDQRYQTATELVRDLTLLGSGRSITQLRLLEVRLVLARRLLAVAAAVVLCALAGLVVTRCQTGRERVLRERAEVAEQTSRRELGEARLQQARAVLQSHEPDRRSRALAAIREAVGIAPTLALRNEGVAALALPAATARPLGSHHSFDQESLAFHQGTGSYLQDDHHGRVRVRAAGDGTVLEDVRFPAGISPQLFNQTPHGRWRYLFSDNRLVGWSATNPAIRFAVELRPGESFEFAPDEAMIGHWREDGRFHRVTLPELHDVDSFPIERARGDFRFSPDGRRLVLFGGPSTRLEAWDMPAGRRRQSVEAAVAQDLLAWSADGRVVCFTGIDSRAMAWEPDSGRLFPVLAGHQSRITDLGFFPNDDTVVTISWDATSRFWEWRTGREILRLNDVGSGLSVDRTTRQFGWNRANASQLRCYEFQPATAVGTFRQPFSCLDAAFSNDEKMLAVAGEGLRIFSLETGAEIFLGGAAGTYRVWWDGAPRTLLTSEFGGLFRNRFEIQPDGRWAVVEHTAVAPAQYQTKHPADGSGQDLAFLDGPLLHVRRPETNLVWEHRQEAAETLAASVDGNWLATGTRNHHGVRLWHARSGRLAWERNLRWGSQVAFSPDSRNLAVSGTEETVVWDVATGAIRWRLPALPDQPGHWHLNYSADGRWLAVARTPYVVQLLDPATGHELVSLKHPLPEYVSEVRFSRSGDSVAVVCESGAIQVWHLGQLRSELEALGLNWK